MTGDDIDVIVERVRSLLGKPDGIQQLDRFCGYMKDLVERDHELREQVRRLGRRATLRGGAAPESGADFYGAVGSFRSKTIKVDVRIHGRSCGYVTLGRTEHRPFRPRNFKSDYEQPVGGRPREWDDPKVLEYLRTAAPKAFKKISEATVESGLIREMLAKNRSSGGTPKQDLLREHQPVLLAGVPFQFPLPIVARKTVEIASGNAGGHADVLARANRGGNTHLRVFEVKRPGANDVAHALDQAIAYCATIEYLVQRCGNVYLPAFEMSPRRSRLPIDAVAFVHVAQREHVARAAERLGRRGRRFGLWGFYYELVPLPGRAPKVVVLDAEEY